MDEQTLMQAPEEAGRGTDTVMAHMTPGEIVIPIDFQQDPQVIEMLQALFEHHQSDINEFTVGAQENKINPETGYPEFGFFRKIAKFAQNPFHAIPKGVENIIQKVAPIALTAAGQPELAAGYSGLNTYAHGGSVGKSLLSAGTSYAGSKLGEALGGANSILGDFGQPIQGPLQTGQASLGSTSGSGIAGALNKASSSLGLGSLSGGGASGGSSTFGGNVGTGFKLSNALATAAGGIGQDEAYKKAQKDLLSSNKQQLANLDTFDPSGITADPGYEFQRAEGEKGLNRSLAAQGGLLSGRAAKAAAQYNQDYANTSFNDFYKRWADKVGSQNSLYGSAGDIKANGGLGRAQNLSQTLSGIFNPVDQQTELFKKLFARA